MSWIIYKHTNKINNKVYIGQTQNSLEERSGSNGCQYTRNPNLKFARAILKYGWNNFTHEIIDYADTQDEADKKEIYWIEYYDSYNNGYNMTSGGQGGTFRDKSTEIICIETNEIFSSISDCSKKTGISVQNLSQNCCKGHRRGRDQRTNALVHFAYLNEYNENWKPALPYNSSRRHEASTRKKEVYCLQTNKFYPSVTDCANELNIPVRSVSRCAQGELITTHGYNFCYKENWYEGWLPRKSIQGKRSIKNE